jgi:hypothetical protein
MIKSSADAGLLLLVILHNLSGRILAHEDVIAPERLNILHKMKFLALP